MGREKSRFSRERAESEQSRNQLPQEPRDLLCSIFVAYAIAE